MTSRPTRRPPRTRHARVTRPRLDSRGGQHLRFRRTESRRFSAKYSSVEPLHDTSSYAWPGFAEGSGAFGCCVCIRRLGLTKIAGASRNPGDRPPRSLRQTSPSSDCVCDIATATFALLYRPETPNAPRPAPWVCQSCCYHLIFLDTDICDFNAAATTVFDPATLPTCVPNCGVLYDVNGACAVGSSNNMGGCFCADPRLTAFSAGPMGVCDGACTNPNDLSSIQKWYTDFCAQQQQGGVKTAAPDAGKSSGGGGGGGSWYDSSHSNRTHYQTSIR